jgi:hypothetical protein
MRRMMVVGVEFAYAESASQAVYRRRDRGSKGQIQARLELKKRDQGDQQKQRPLFPGFASKSFFALDS